MADIDFQEHAPIDFQESPTAPPPAPSELTSFGHHAVNSLLFGGLPKIQGALTNPMGALKSAGSYIGAPADAADPDVKAYMLRKMQEQSQLANEAQANPKSAIAGDVGGAIGSAFLPGVGPAMAAVGGGVKGAAALGGAYGLINSNASSPGEALKDVGTGAVVGGAIQGIGEHVIAPAFNRLVSGETAENLMTRHLRPTPAIARAMGPEGLQNMSREVLDSGAVGFGQKVGQTAENLADASSAAGALKGDIVDAATSAIDPQTIADKFQKNVIDKLSDTAENQDLVAQLTKKKQNFLDKYSPKQEPDLSGHLFQGVNEGTPPGTDTGWWTDNLKTAKGYAGPNGKVNVAARANFEPGVLENGQEGIFQGSPSEISHSIPTNEFSGEAGLADKMGLNKPQTMSPAQLENEKMAVQNNINYKTDPSAKIQANRDWATTLKQGAEEAIDNPAFQDSKRAFGNLRSAQNMAERTAGLTDGGTGLMGHLTDVGLGTEALHLAATGNPAGLALGGARMLTKGRVSSAGAVAADNAAKAYQSVKQALNSSDIVQKLSGTSAAKFAGAIRSAATQGQGALAATHFILQQVSGPYSEAVNGEQ